MDSDEFVSAHAPSEGDSSFEFKNSRFLDIALDGGVMAKAGSMIGYTGDISLERRSAGGLRGMFKQKATGEGDIMMQATGIGHLYLADQGKEVQIPEFDTDEELGVNGNDVLAFESSASWDIKMLTSVAGASSGGLFNVFLEGPGHVAITTHGEPIVVPTLVRTDPNATVAWSRDVSPSSSRGIDIKGLLGRSSSESYQLEFAGEGGFVIVQPFEEVAPGQ